MFLLLLSFLLPPLTGGSATTAPGDSVVVLPEITVTATRTPASEADAPARISSFDREDIRAAGTRSVAELLAARSTGFIRHYGNGLATLSLRGAAPGHTLIMVDGQRLSDVQTGQIDLSLIPSVLLERVEIVHGAGSALYGSDGVAGVVNLHTAGRTHKPNYAVEATAGAFGARGVAGRVGVPVGRWMLTAAGEMMRSAGDFSVAPDVARRLDARREGADKTLSTLYATARRAGTRHALATSLWTSSAERGLPGPITTPPVGERQWDRQLRLWGSDEITWNRSALKVSGGIHAASIRYTNPQLELDETGTSTSHFLESTFRIERRRLDLTVGGIGDYTYARHPSRRDAYIAHAAGFLAASVRAGVFHLFPAVRVDGYRAPDATGRVAWSPRLGFSTPLPGIRGVQLKSSAGRTFRVPTLNERYWQPGGQPDLRPEQGWHGDLGLRYQARRVTMELSTFLSVLQDEILWLPSRAGHHEALNLRRTRNLGLELSGTGNASLGANRFVHGGAVLTLTRATDRSDPARSSFDEQLRYVPPMQAKAFVSVYAGPASIDLNTRYVGRRYVTTDGSQWVEPFVVVDAQVRLRYTLAGTAVALTASIENLLDARYAVIQHYPMPPRHVRISLNLSDAP